MKKILWLAGALLASASACSAPDMTAGSGAGGAGGAATTSVNVAANHAVVATSSTGALDAGCSTCEESVAGPDQIGAAHRLCVGIAETYYYNLTSCGCNEGGACWLTCVTTAFCAGLRATPQTWTDPAGTCDACMHDGTPKGCGAAWTVCLLH